jgi:uncharacterized metal-binding protein YceD (DUF177 family)
MKTGSLSLSVRADEVPAAGRRFRVEADEAERRALAAELGISEVVELAAEFDVRPTAGEAFSVRGSLAATVVQSDIVTLEPLRQTIDERIELTLVAAEENAPETSLPVDPEASEERDVFHNGRIELGRLAREHLAVGLDPYPRAPGVEFADHVEDGSLEASPFAALAKLKKEQE